MSLPSRTLRRWSLPLGLVAGFGIVLALIWQVPSVSAQAPTIDLGSADAEVAPIESAQTPAIADVIPVAPLGVELTDRLEELRKHAESEEAFEKAADQKWGSACGVLACIGQALSLHPQGSEVSGDKLAIRDAAMELAVCGDAEEARQYLDILAEAIDAPGAVNPDSSDAAEPDGVDWYSLIDSYSLMEEINTRNSKLVRVSRRPRGKPEEAAHAAVIALLCYPMHAQAEDYVGDDDLGDYQTLAVQYQSQVSEMAAAVSAKDGPLVKEKLTASTQTCNQCHEKYRDGE